MIDGSPDRLDAAAGFASDLEALGGMARELEEQQSTEQLSSVNASIESYFRTITGAAAERRVQVRAKKTAAKVTYQLVDAEGRAITSLLNQAAFNALSLATLFASGESRAREGRTQFFVLDDPGQGLDEAHQAGLARALAQAASVAPCLVATFPGVLASELEGTDSPAALTHHLSSGVAASTTEAAEGWS